jgi:hypothetical protein
MTNLSAPSRKRLSELGLDAWRSRMQLDEERANSVGQASTGAASTGHASAGQASAGRAAAAAPAAAAAEADAEESLRSHYSSSPPHSHRSNSPGWEGAARWLAPALPGKG